MNGVELSSSTDSYTHEMINEVLLNYKNALPMQQYHSQVYSMKVNLFCV